MYTIFAATVINNYIILYFMKKIYLKPGREAAVKRFHPWVFSGGVKHIKETISDGETVEVYSHENQYLATGHFQQGSILVRIISFNKTEIDQAFWNKKIQNAYQYRQNIGQFENLSTNCFRLVHAEGDGLPGLIIDIYNKTAIIQCHSIGMYLEREKISNALKEILGENLEAIYNKSSNALPSKFAENVEDQYLLGASNAGIVIENGNKFFVDWEKGQKTGFFLDQRENRNLLTQYVEGKSVLNAFCYSGGFSIYALKANAKLVHSVDISQKAIDWTNKNVSLNGDILINIMNAYAHGCFEISCNHARRRNMKSWLSILQLMQNQKLKRHNAVQGYKRLNALGFKKDCIKWDYVYILLLTSCG